MNGLSIFEKNDPKILPFCIYVHPSTEATINLHFF